MKRHILLLMLSTVGLHGQKTVLGLERANPAMFNESAQSFKIGLITNQTGMDQAGNRNIDILLQKGFQIITIFAPEHGLSGTVHAEKEVGNEYDAKTGIPVISLYGKGTGKRIQKEDIDHLDALMFDIQDSGMRHYTYISTLYRAMQTAAQAGKKVIVLDRPNPLGGLMSGPLVDASILATNSFIAIADIPVRHGMTIGELALYFNKHIFEKSVDLMIIAMESYSRTLHDFKLLAPLSPNIPNISSLYGYSFLGLLGEVSPLDVGVLTDHPFQVIALPIIDVYENFSWKHLQAVLKKYGIETKPHEYFSERKKMMFKGILITTIDPLKVRTSVLFLDILDILELQKIPLTFAPYFSSAIGMPSIQKMYTDHSVKRAEIEKKIHEDVQAFLKRAQDCFLYRPYPYIP